MDPCGDFSVLGKRIRVLIVELKSATFLEKYKKSGEIYANLWIHQDLKLQTRIVHCSKNTSTTFENQKFLFSVPPSFFNNENESKNGSAVWFEIVHHRKYLSDSVLGFAKCKIADFFPELQIKDESKEETTGPNYDTDNDSIKSVEEDGEEFVEGRHVELKKSVSIDMFVKDFSIKTGVLNAELTVWKNYIGRIGHSGSQPIAMNYDEFMMENLHHENGEYKKKKTSIFMCFGPKNTKD